MASPPDPPPDDGDPFADEPDAWAEADRAWEAGWSGDEAPPDEGALPHEGDPLAGRTDAPPPSGYRPRRATVGGTADAYGDGMRAAGPYLGLGLQIGLSMALFVGLGILADSRLETSPWGVIAGAVLGMVAVLALVVRIAREADAKGKGGRGA